jgi:S-adenosylmethionine:tRNA ribosyltransferase-isomerase
MRTDEFDFELPEALIAQHPPEKRGASRLLHMRADGVSDMQFVDLPGLIREHDILVFNDTRVLKARLFGNKESGGRVEVLIERILDDHEALAQVRASKPPKPGGRLALNGLPVLVLGRQGEFYRLRFESGEDIESLLDAHGQLPLPPYIAHAAGQVDEERYQTVYAREPGAVAAPTAGLHFDAPMMADLLTRGAAIAYVTLHVGAGTFQPVRAENIEEHVMHNERYRIPQETVDAVRRARSRGGRVIAVGTTSLRALESAAASGDLSAGSGETQIFITPGFKFKVADLLLTNFHLPRSTLIMLACAFGDKDAVLAAYRHAVAEKYRFFSYGDAMLIERQRD